MVAEVARSRVEDFFAALATRDPQLIGPFLAHDVDWLIVGPVELFPFCGQHVGKDAVLAVYERMSKGQHVLEYVRDQLVVEGSSGAALVRVRASQKETGREGQVRIAQFVRFSGDQVVEFCSILDSLSAAEQALGHAIDFSAPAPATVPGEFEDAGIRAYRRAQSP